MARSSGSTLRMKQQRSGSVLYRGPGSVRGLSSTILRPYRVANRSLNSYVSAKWKPVSRSEEHTSELQSLAYLVCRLLLEKKKKHHLKSAKQYLLDG